MKKPAKTSEAKQKTSSFFGFPEEKCNTPHKRGSRAEKKRKKPRVFEGQRSQSAERVHFANRKSKKPLSFPRFEPGNDDRASKF